MSPVYCCCVVIFVLVCVVVVAPFFSIVVCVDMVFVGVGCVGGAGVVVWSSFLFMSFV